MCVDSKQKSGMCGLFLCFVVDVMFLCCFVEVEFLCKIKVINLGAYETCEKNCFFALCVQIGIAALLLLLL